MACPYNASTAHCVAALFMEDTQRAKFYDDTCTQLATYGVNCTEDALVGTEYKDCPMQIVCVFILLCITWPYAMV